MVRRPSTLAVSGVVRLCARAHSYTMQWPLRWKLAQSASVKPRLAKALLGVRLLLLERYLLRVLLEAESASVKVFR